MIGKQFTDISVQEKWNKQAKRGPINEISRIKGTQTE